MISAEEARLVTEEYLKGRVKINKVLDFIDGVIKIACSNGESHVFIKEDSFHNLSLDQMKVVVDELGDFGYKITPISEEHRAGYDIEW